MAYLFKFKRRDPVSTGRLYLVMSYPSKTTTVFRVVTLKLKLSADKKQQRMEALRGTQLLSGSFISDFLQRMIGESDVVMKRACAAEFKHRSRCSFKRGLVCQF